MRLNIFFFCAVESSLVSRDMNLPPAIPLMPCTVRLLEAYSNEIFFCASHAGVELDETRRIFRDNFSSLPFLFLSLPWVHCSPLLYLPKTAHYLQPLSPLFTLFFFFFFSSSSSRPSSPSSSALLPSYPPLALPFARFFALLRTTSRSLCCFSCSSSVNTISEQIIH